MNLLQPALHASQWLRQRNEAFSGLVLRRVCDLESNSNSDAGETGKGAIGDSECVKCWVCKEYALDMLIMVLRREKMSLHQSILSAGLYESC